MKKGVILLLAAVLALAACGAQGKPAARPSTTAAPPRASAPLVAVLQGHAGGNRGAGANAIALVGLDGTVKGGAVFQPRQAPYVGNAMAVLQSEAQVGRAGVYYVDGYGVVRLLTPAGQTKVVATFPATPQQHEVWYAVSPDGKQLLAGVLTIPPAVPGYPFPSVQGTWKFDLESATAGGSTRVLKHVEAPQGPDAPGATWKTIFPVGWTDAGPVAMVGAPLATQNAWAGGPLYVIDASGQPAQRVGGAGVTASQILASGVIPAVDASLGGVTVRDASGQVLWRPAAQPWDALTLRLSPDGNAISDVRHAVTRAGAFPVPDQFYSEGWMDAQTLFGRSLPGQSYGSLSYVRLADPGTLHDLGVLGDFAGVLVVS